MAEQDRERIGEAEWDFTTGEVLAVKLHDADVRPTGRLRQRDAEAHWLPLDMLYPDDYLPDFPELLGDEFVYELADSEDAVLRRHLHANFSDEAIRATQERRVRNNMANLLGRTDGYYVRRLDTGEDVPEQIQQLRDYIREQGDTLREMIREDPIEDVIGLNWDWREVYYAINQILAGGTRLPPITEEGDKTGIAITERREYHR